MSVVLPVENFDWKNPNYVEIFQRRADRLDNIRQNPESVSALKAYYKTNGETIAQFIIDWGCTLDPRNVERDLPALMPFILFPKQIEWVIWVYDLWKRQKNGLTEKSRDAGMSWLSVAFAVALSILFDGVTIGFGSRKEEYVDKSGSPKCLFYKARLYLKYLPVEFRAGFDEQRTSTHMRLFFPETSSHITGEAGDNIGRGDRASIYFVDEAAHIERAESVEAALSQTTNCRIDISSVNGMANPFAQKRHSGKLPVFTFHWRDDPRKDEEWYRNTVEQINNLTIVAQELDIDYLSSSDNSVIPASWVKAAIDAHLKLQIDVTGERMASLDVGDEGKDHNALCGGYGILLEYIEFWSGKDSDIFETTRRAFRFCDSHNYQTLIFDSDGIGAGVRGDARVLNEKRAESGKSKIDVVAYRGSMAVLHPKKMDVKGRKNEDFFANLKAQAWWRLRDRFYKTYKAINEGFASSHDDLISLPKELKDIDKLLQELSQATFSVNNAGKILVDKAPDGVSSPNLADAVVMRYSGIRSQMIVNPQSLARSVGVYSQKFNSIKRQIGMRF
jgi:hypothetical protein